MRTLLALGSSALVALLAPGGVAQTREAAAAPADALVGRWVGPVQQRDVKGKPFAFTVAIRIVPAYRHGVSRLAVVRRCTGTMRYRSRAAGAYVFALTMRRPCLPGTVRLRMLGRDAVRYTWDGRYPDGSPAHSTGKLARTA